MRHVNRYILPALCLFLFATGCHRQPDTLFTLRGEVQDAASREFYLFSTERPFRRIDTIRPDRQGKFVYQTELDTLVRLTLYLGPDVTLPVFADKGRTVFLKGSALSADSLHLRGGAENDTLEVFNREVRLLRDSLQRLASADSFIRRHPSSQVSVYLLDRYFVQTPRPNYPRIDTLIQSMSGMLHDHPLILSVRKNLDNTLKSDTGHYVPNFRLKNLKDDNLTSYHFRDKVLVISFWATWNQGSLAVQEELKALQKRFQKKEVAFVYYCMDLDRERWKEAVRKDTLSGEQVCDGEGWESLVVRQFGVERIPAVVVLSPQRKVALRASGTQGVEDAVNALLRQEKERKDKLKRR